MDKAIIQTHSGIMVDLLHPDPFALQINDIAHALAFICRFGGHTREFYSVAQHSLMVALNVPAEDALAGLMHDATEAYCGDMVAPLKACMPAYRDVEAGLWEALAYRYRLPAELPASVRHADKVLLATEQRDLACHYRCPDCELDCLQGAQPLAQRLQPMSPAASYAAFIKHFHYLWRNHNAKK